MFIRALVPDYSLRDKPANMMKGNTILSTQVSVTTAERPVQPSEHVHKVVSEPRGRVLILNYEKFKHKENNRLGAEKDRHKLHYLFTEVSHDLRKLYLRNL